MAKSTFDFSQLEAAAIEQLDRKAVETYNHTALEKYRLRTELGPYAFEGDLANARVALLLSNPGFGEGSTPESHTYRRDGWPLAGLHPNAPAGTFAWTNRLLKQLVQQVDAQTVSQRVVKLEATPWASVKMDGNLRLPSRAVVLQAASELARRGVILVVMRSEALWLAAPEISKCRNRYRVKNWRSASVSVGNLGQDAWLKVLTAVRG